MGGLRDRHNSLHLAGAEDEPKRMVAHAAQVEAGRLSAGFHHAEDRAGSLNIEYRRRATDPEMRSATLTLVLTK